MHYLSPQWLDFAEWLLASTHQVSAKSNLGLHVHPSVTTRDSFHHIILVTRLTRHKSAGIAHSSCQLSTYGVCGIAVLWEMVELLHGGETTPPRVYNYPVKYNHFNLSRLLHSTYIELGVTTILYT